jgi:hypothetical protein
MNASQQWPFEPGDRVVWLYGPADNVVTVSTCAKIDGVWCFMTDGDTSARRICSEYGVALEKPPEEKPAEKPATKPPQRRVLRDAEMFGPSKFSHADIAAAEAETPFVNIDLEKIGAAMRAPAQPQPIGAAPFRVGQVVRQKTGEHCERNRRVVVEAVKFVTDRDFRGWAIRLQGRDKPYAADLFEPLGESEDAQQDAGEYMPTTIDVRRVGEVCFVELDGTERLRVTQSQVYDFANSDGLLRYVMSRARVSQRTAMVISMKIANALFDIRDPSAVKPTPPPEQTPEPAAAPATGKRRIIRPGRN